MPGGFAGSRNLRLASVTGHKLTDINGPALPPVFAPSELSDTVAMDSQSSLDDMSTPTDTPTPMALDAFPPCGQPEPLSRSLSPMDSMNYGMSANRAISQESAKYSSPGPNSSMTPPPSLQVPGSRAAAASFLSAELTPSALSSLPPMSNGHRGVTSYTKPSAHDIAEASTERLREMLQTVLAENNMLDMAASEARMSAAHHKLQHNLLSIETEEAMKRMEVEHYMTRQEVEVLHRASRGALDPNSPAQEYIANLKKDLQSLQLENVALNRRLDKANSDLLTQYDQLVEGDEERKRLLARIWQNRQNINELRKPGGPWHIDFSPPSYPATPQQYRTTPKRTPVTGSSVRQARRSQEGLAALLLAADHQNNSAPSTPIVGSHAEPRTPSKHNRGAQSLSSIPTTPGRPATANSLLPSITFTPQAQRNNDTRDSSIQHSRQRVRRRKSRDSTISASDAEELARTTGYREESEEIEVQESQASSKAVEMLREDPRESFEVHPSRTTTPTQSAEKNLLLQATISGQITKPSSEKRKRSDEASGSKYSSKKSRADLFDEAQGPIGLGIGFEGGL